LGLGAALDYLDEIGIENVNRYEHELLTYATAALTAVPGLRVMGTAREKAAVISFVLDEFRTEDVAARWPSTTPLRISMRWCPPSCACRPAGATANSERSALAFRQAKIFFLFSICYKELLSLVAGVC